MTGKKSKIVSVALIVLMFGAIFGALPAITSGASESENGTIAIAIKDNSSGNAVPAGYVVNVYNIYANSMSEYTLSTDGYIAIDVPAGHYVIYLPAQEIGGKAYFPGKGDMFQVSSGETSSQNLEVDTENIVSTVSGTVSYSGNPVEGAVVSLIDYDNDFSFSATTDENGSYSIDVYDADFSLWAEKKGTGRFYSEITVSGDSTQDIGLTDVPYIKGFVRDQDGKGIVEPLHISVFDNNSKTVIRVDETTGPFFSVPVYASDSIYVLVSVDGYDSYFNNSVSTDGPVDADLGNINLNTIEPSSDRTVFTFHNFNNMSMTRTLVYAPYNTISAFDFPESGNLRYQIDSNHDGVVNASEESDFKALMESGMKPVSTGETLMVNGISYVADEGNSHNDIDAIGVAGPVDSTSPITITIKYEFKASDNISTDDISLKARVKYDSEYMVYNYSIILPSGYERSGVSAPSDISVGGYTTVDIDPETGDGSADVKFDIVESREGTATIDVATGEYVYEMDNGEYVVKVGKNVSFNAVFDDPNGHEDGANYTWKIDSGMLYGRNVVYKFVDEKEYTVNLTVTDVGGKMAYSEVTMHADRTAPVIVTSPSGHISVDEKESIEFNASGSHDNVVGEDDLHYMWEFGDGNSSVQKIADHSYEKWGTYTVTVNVTDVVGNYATSTISVTVNDITPPVAIFNWTVDNETHSSDDAGTATVIKGDSVHFDASPSYDPAGAGGEQGAITAYSWYFEDDGSEPTSMSLDHTFSDAGTYTVKLNVSDAHGNHREITKIFEVKYGPVPRLEIKNLTLSTDEPRAGQTMQIVANVSNFGDADANSPTVIFYVNDHALGGTVRFYEYSNGSLVESTQMIPAGGYRIVKIDWTPEKGNVMLKVNATDSGEPSSSFLNEKEIKVTVGQPVWMDYLPIILAVIAILGVVAIYMMYSKGMGPFSEKKGEKQEKK